jgi:type IV pilus assembly protein PilP
LGFAKSPTDAASVGKAKTDSQEVEDVSPPGLPGIEDPLEEGKEKTKKKEEAYNPIGKRDPFTSFVVELEKISAGSHSHPLQKFQLAQLKLIGVVVGIPYPKAMFEDPAGKAWIVGPGTHIGKNFGKIKKITNESVVVMEEYHDASGGLTLNEVVVKLYQGSGEVLQSSASDSQDNQLNSGSYGDSSSLYGSTPQYGNTSSYDSSTAYGSAAPSTKYTPQTYTPPATQGAIGADAPPPPPSGSYQPSYTPDSGSSSGSTPSNLTEDSYSAPSESDDGPKPPDTGGN